MASCGNQGRLCAERLFARMLAIAAAIVEGGGRAMALGLAEGQQAGSK